MNKNQTFFFISALQAHIQSIEANCVLDMDLNWRFYLIEHHNHFSIKFSSLHLKFHSLMNYVFWFWNWNSAYEMIVACAVDSFISINCKFQLTQQKFYADQGAPTSMLQEMKKKSTHWYKKKNRDRDNIFHCMVIWWKMNLTPMLVSLIKKRNIFLAIQRRKKNMQTHFDNFSTLSLSQVIAFMPKTVCIFFHFSLFFVWIFWFNHLHEPVHI